MSSLYTLKENIFFAHDQASVKICRFTQCHFLYATNIPSQHCFSSIRLERFIFFKVVYNALYSYYAMRLTLSLGRRSCIDVFQSMVGWWLKLDSLSWSKPSVKFVAICRIYKYKKIWYEKRVNYKWSCRRLTSSQCATVMLSFTSCPWINWQHVTKATNTVTSLSRVPIDWVPRMTTGVTKATILIVTSLSSGLISLQSFKWQRTLPRQQQHSSRHCNCSSSTVAMSVTTQLYGYL